MFFLVGYHKLNRSNVVRFCVNKWLELTRRTRMLAFPFSGGFKGGGDGAAVPPTGLRFFFQ